MCEDWYIIIGYDKYIVSSLGTVKRVGITRGKTGSVIKPFIANGYKKVSLCINGKVKKFYIHRLVVAGAFRIPPENVPTIDHINRDRTDNRLSNLRIASNSLNSHNRPCMIKTSKYRGVSFDKERCLWVAYGSYSGKTIYLGRYKSEQKAAEAYNKFAKNKWGDNALLNNQVNKFEDS